MEGERRVAVIPDGWYQGRVRRIAWSSPAGASGAPTNKTFYGIVTRVRSLHTPKIRRPFLFIGKSSSSTNTLNRKPHQPHLYVSCLPLPCLPRGSLAVYPFRSGIEMKSLRLTAMYVPPCLFGLLHHRWDPGLVLATRCLASSLALQTHALPRPPLPLLLGLGLACGSRPGDCNHCMQSRKSVGCPLRRLATPMHTHRAASRPPLLPWYCTAKCGSSSTPHTSLWPG